VDFIYLVTCILFIQIRYFLLTATDKIQLPPAQQLLLQFSTEMNLRKSLDQKQSQYHAMMACQWQYVDDLKKDILQSYDVQIRLSRDSKEVEKLNKKRDFANNLFPDYVKKLFNLTVYHLILNFSQMKFYDYKLVRNADTKEVKFREYFRGTEINTNWTLVLMVLRQVPLYVLTNILTIGTIITKMFYYKCKKFFLA